VISATPPPDGFVFVHIDANGVDDIYYMNLDGTGVRALTNDAAGDFDPAVSPDGQRVAWHSVRDGSHAIWVMNIDGSGAHRLPTCGFSSMPTWSPDGTRIAYHSNCSGGNDDLWMTNADGSGAPARLTIDPAVDATPAWSPDGGRIAFARTSNGSVSGYDLFVLTLATGQAEQVSFRAGEDDFPQWSADGTSLVHNCDNQACITDVATHATRQATNSAAFSDHRPSWSADGKLISFIAPRLPGVGMVWLMNADGTGAATPVGDPTMNTVQAALVTHAPPGITARRAAAGFVFVRTLNGMNDLWYANLDGTGLRALTTNSGAVEARVSPNGSRVAWRSAGAGNQLWIANIDGTNAHALATCNYNSDPSWSPDGLRIVYHSNCAGGDHLWIINADGTGNHQLTSGGVIEGMPAWSPDGSQIAFGRLATGSVADYDVWTLDLATGQQQQVTFHAGPDFYPQWSPDGKAIVHDCGTNILQACVTNVATHVTQQFTGPDNYQSRRPAISPDGSLIAYAGFVPNSATSGIWTKRADGSGAPTLVSDPSMFVFQPAWVPRAP
jgi:TolB protein